MADRVFSFKFAKFVPSPGKSLLCLPHRLLGWVMINTFGLKLIYPGSTKWLLQSLIGPALTEHRAKLVAKANGERFKVETRDGNQIDSMFFDKRSLEGKGKTLVICCEGNAGFYELGMLETSLDAGYSVLGWNHPGFWGSTGSPLPSQDAHAAEAVMKLATEKLGFKHEEIIVYGWSIGGFPASWLAMNYPKIKGVILDATFDHLTPLAKPRMPAFLEKVVEVSIEDNVNLDVAQQIVQYDGPVRLVRRTKDEMIATNDDDVLGSNRGNYLLMEILRHRFPRLFEAECLDLLHAFVSSDKKSQESFLALNEIHEDEMQALLTSYIANKGESYPMAIGDDMSDEIKAQLLVFIASKYRSEYDSTHNAALPVDLFQFPWTPCQPTTN